jgi:UDP-N-acetylglucosamine--N-acetylmuramyl-(pentapeptide) pyrophosphoryl-undecaprenol N-acetylglucosamine transferase
MHILVTGGGTGGHVYPALSILDAFDKAERAELALAWVGREGGVEQQLAARQGIAFWPLPMAPVVGTRALGLVRNLWDQVRGVLAACRLIAEWHPDAVLATGGYVSVPLVVAAWLKRVPVLLYLPDMEPGLAVRWLAPLATVVAVSFEQVRQQFRRAVVVTGYPVRSALLHLGRYEARRQLGLSGERPVLLVMGGSRGAGSINRAVFASLSSWVQEMQVIHMTGPADLFQAESIKNAMDVVAQGAYWPCAYLYDDLAAALVAADLVVARSGAATLGEFPAVGLPAVLVPYPHAGEHQARNARFLAERGAAVVLADEDLGQSLLPTVSALMRDRERRETMALAAQGLAAPQAARQLAEIVMGLAAGASGAPARGG